MFSDKVKAMEEGLLDQESLSWYLKNPKKEIGKKPGRSWSAQMLEMEQRDPTSIKMLTTTKKLQFFNVLSGVVLFQDDYLWRLLLLMVLYVDYILKTFEICFIKKHDTPMVQTVDLFSVVLYLVDYICAVIILTYKKMHLLVVHRYRGQRALVFDTFIIIPYHMIYLYASHEKQVSWVYALLASVSFTRLYQFSNYFDEKSNNAGLKHWKYFLAKYIIYISIFTHTITCMFYMVSCPFRCTKPTGWALVQKPAGEKETTTLHWYIYAWYMAFMNLTNSGFPTFLPTDLPERLITSITMSLGFVTTTLIFIGALSSDLVSKLYRIAILRAQLALMSKHLSMIGMSLQDTTLIMNYFNIFWRKKKGVKEAEAISMLPLPMQLEISYDVNYSLLQCSLLFRYYPEPFLRTLSLNMQHEFFQPGEVIFKHGSIKYKMICVASGVIEILSDEDYESPIISFSAGSVIGEAALVLTLPNRTTVRAATYCELQVLYKKHFCRIIKLFPQIYLQIRGTILKRIEFVRDDNRIRKDRKGFHMNLYVSQKMHFSPIMRVKKRLTGEIFEDPIPEHHNACGLYKFATNVKKIRGTYVTLSTKTCPMILEPDTDYVQYWRLLVLMDVLLIAILYPYFIAFEKKFPPVMDYISVVLELIYVVDIWFVLSTAIEEKDLVIRSIRGIAAKQLKTWGFYMDLLSATYIEFFFFNNKRYYYVVKINRLLKCYRILTYFARLETNLRKDILKIRMIKYAIYIGLANYWLGVLLYTETCFYDVCDQHGWYMELLKKEQYIKDATPCTDHKVTISLYFGMTVLTTLGYNDVSPETLKDMIIVIAGVILGIFLVGYCTSELSATITYRIQTKIDFQTNMFAVEKFITDNELDTSIKTRVLQFFELQWYYNSGAGIGNQNTLLNSATHDIRKKIMIKERLETILLVPLFQHTSIEFVRMIAAGSRTIVLPPNEWISYAGGASRELYIIQEGFCVNESNSGEFISLLYPGYHFGLQSILREIRCIHNVKTITHVKVVAISDAIFHSSISIFPDIWRQIDSCIQPQAESVENLKEKKRIAVKQKKEKLFDWLRRSMVSESFVYVPRYCELHGEEYDAPFRKLGFFFRLKYLLVPICILPQGLFLKIWLCIRLCQAVLTALLIPYQLVQAPYIPSLDGAMVLLDIIAYVDLYLMLLVGFYGESNQIIIHPYKTAGHYLKGSFILDFLLCFPYELIVKSLMPEHNEGHSEFSHTISPHVFHCIVRLIRVFQIYRLPLFFFYADENVRIAGLFIQVLKFVPVTIIFLNICASLIIITSCKYYHISDLEHEITKDMHASPPNRGKKLVREYTMFCYEDCWIERSQFQSYYTPESIHLLAFYWATETIVGCGFADLSAQHLSHIILNIVLMITGKFFFGFVFAYTASHTADLNSSLSVFQEMVEEFNKFCDIENVKKSSANRVLNITEYRWSRDAGIEPNVILATVHSVLHEDAVLQLYEATLKEVPLFEGVDRSFFRILGQTLREKYYVKSTFIFRENDVIDTVFIIHRGKVEITFCMNFYEIMTTYMGVGGIIGNISNLPQSKMFVTVSALSNVDTLIIKTEDLYSILKRYPEIKRKIESTLDREEHKDFIIPARMMEDEDDSSAESVREPSDDTFSDDQEARDSSSIAAGQSSAGFSSGASGIGKKELSPLLLIFKPKRWCKVAIDPNNRIFVCVGLLCVIGAYINACLVTYQFTFQDFNPICTVVLMVIDIIFIWEIFLEMHKGYLNKYNEYITNSKKIRKRYFSYKKQRIYDLVANVPIAYLAFIFPLFSKIDYQLIYSVLRLLSLLRLLYCYQYFKSTSVNVIVDRLILDLGSVFVWISFALHVLSCVWYMIACPIAYCYPDSWVTVFYEQPRAQYEIYLICLYFILSVSTQTAIGDIVPHTKLEIVFLTLIMLFVIFLVGIFIGMASNVMSLHTSALVRYEENIHQLRDCLRNQNVSDHQLDKMWNYVKQIWAKRNGRQIPRFIENLTHTNRCQIKYEVYGTHFRTSYLFKNLDEHFLRQLSNHINPIMFFPGNYIVQHGDSDQSMYFVHRGEVEVLTVHTSLTETIHDVLQAGEMFGLAQGLFYGVPHHFFFRARTTCDILMLRLQDWENMLLLFPHVKEIIYHRARGVYTVV